MNILGTGLSGLVGTRVVELLSGEFQFENLSLDTGVDITDKEKITKRINESSALWVFHFAAVTDVDGAEKERSLGQGSKTWRVNVDATQYIIDACNQSGKRLLYISTDFVFDGTKDKYTEEDIPNPQGWYAVTKYEAEKRVASLGQNGLIVRIAFPYRTINDIKKDFVHRMLDELAGGKDLIASTDQIFVPTFIDDIAIALQSLVDNNAHGTCHVVGSQGLSPYQAGQKLAVLFGYSPEQVKPITFAQLYGGRAPRPFHAHLTNDKITKFGVRMSTFDEGLQRVKSQKQNEQNR